MSKGAKMIRNYSEEIIKNWGISYQTILDYDFQQTPVETTVTRGKT